MLVETKEAIFESYFQHAQVEITGYCNMRCEHCRAYEEENRNMNLSLYTKILDFIELNRAEDFRLTISGGEPFINKNIVEYLRLAKERSIDNIIITTNASLVTDEKLSELDGLNIGNLCIQVSLDSINRETHDSFRHFTGAYDKAVTVLGKIKNYPHLKSSIRMSVVKGTIPEVESMVDMAYEMGVDRIGIGAVIPVGAGKDGRLTISKEDKKHFLEILAAKKREYFPKLEVTTEDPLKFLVANSPWAYDSCGQESDFWGGCTAGISGFNVNVEGIITPCAVLNEEIVDMNKLSADEAASEYVVHPTIVKLFERNFSGKCNKCRLKYVCGGCRATAKSLTGDLMGIDNTCWR